VPSKNQAAAPVKKQAATPRIYQAPEIRPPGRPRAEDLSGAGDPFVRGSVRPVGCRVASAAGLRVVEEAGRRAGEEAGCRAAEDLPGERERESWSWDRGRRGCCLGESESL
jgi:hypothetical protein